MISFFKIWTIAFFETKTLLRSWFFRIFALLAVATLIFLNYFFFVNERSASWTLRGIPSTIPYMNLMLLNIIQAIIGIFMASDFLKFDKKLDSTEVIYMRSMTNADYVFGKSLGIFIVFFLLNFLVLSVAFVFNVFFITDVPFEISSYIYYPLFISIPTLIFIFGLSFLFMTLMKSQALTFILLLGYVAGTLFFLGNKYHYLFDYMVSNVPLLYSDFVGFGETGVILIHRGIYFLLGMGFIFATILFMKRLPQSKIMNRTSLIMAVLCIGTALLLGNSYLSKILTGRELRQQMSVLNKEIAKNPAVSITKCALDLTHLGDEIEVRADIDFTNENSSAIDVYSFSINPGLEILSAESNGRKLNFSRNLHILTIEPDNPLQAGESTSLSLHYRGKINEEACYVDINEEQREESYNLFLYKVAKRYSFITPEYVLLTSENLWYPVAGLPYDSVYPDVQKKDFVDFELTVTTKNSLTALSQGKSEQTGDGKYTFKPEVPLPQLSLVIGRYEKKSVTVDGIDYNLFIKPGHDYFSDYFDKLGETLTEMIRESKDDYERKIYSSYPYNRLSIIETPVQFTSYERLWTLHSETVQPEQVFLPEKGFLMFQADFKRNQYWETHGRRGHEQTRTPEEIQSNSLRRFINGVLLDNTMSRVFSRQRRNITSGDLSVQRMIFSSFLPSSMPSFEISPNYLRFTSNFSSEQWPIFNVSLVHYLKSRLEDDRRFLFRRFGQGLTEEETACIELSKQNLSEIITDPEQQDILYSVLDIKANYLFALLRKEIGDEMIDEFLNEFLAEYKFKNVDAKTFLETLEKVFDINIESYFDQWYYGKGLPAYYITDLKCTEILENEKTLYQVQFKAFNPEEIDGLISASFRMGRMGGGFPGAMGMGRQDNQEEYYFIIKGNQTKEIGIVLDQMPDRVSFNTFISQNVPGSFDRRFEKPELDKNAVIFEGERILEEPPELSESGEIIVDNEDSGFEVLTKPHQSFLKKLLNKNNTTEDEYTGFNFWRPPNRWKAAIHEDFYGFLKKSAYYIKSGGDSQKVCWEAEIPSSGNYDIYVYTPNFSRFNRMGRRGGNSQSSIIEDMNFDVYHDEGTDAVTLEAKEAEDGWTYLGTYYLSQGTAKIELSNNSKGRIVYADAIKWVKK